MKKAYIIITILAFMIFSLTIPAEAAIDTGNSTTASSVGAYSVTLEKPSDTEAGDILVACILAATTLSNVDVAPIDNSWHLIRTTNADQDRYYDMVTYYKIASSSEPDKYTWTSSFINTSGSITRLTGVDINHVVDASADNQGQGTAAFIDKNAGNAKSVSVLGVTLGGASAANYTVSQPNGLTANITPKDITGSFTTENKVYNGTTDAAVLSRSLTGVLSNEEKVELAGGTAAFDNKNAGIDKMVILSGASLAGADVGNYHLTNVASTTADITQKTVAPSIIANDKVYDASTSAILGSQTVSGVIDPDVVTLVVGAANFAQKNVGEWTVTATALSLGGADAANYTLSATSAFAKAKIAAYGLTITGVAAVDKIYDGYNMATLNFNGAVLVGILGSDSVSISSTGHSAMFDNRNASDSKPVTVLSIALTGSDAANYTVAPPNGLTADITPLDITGSFTAANKVYDGTATGIATFEVPADTLGVETYSATITLKNTYFKATSDENVLVIFDPSLGFTTGGGWFYWPTGTANPELEGAKTNFGFTMKYNRKGTSVQGSFLLIAHQADGSIIRIKSNAVYGMAILVNSYPGIASFSGKCVYTRVDALGNVLATAGNQDFTAYVNDMNEPGEGTDMFWFTTKLTIVGEEPFSLDNNADSKVDEAEYTSLGGGNIVVPHKNSSSDGIVDEETPPSNNGKKK